MPCHLRRRWAPEFLAAGAAAFAAAGASAAQESDPTARYDIDEAMGRHPHDVSELPTAETAGGRAVTFDLSLAAAFSTNAAATARDRIDTGYLTPALGLDITPVSFAGWNVGGGTQLDADIYTSTYDDELGEGRLEGFVFAQRDLAAGSLTGEFIWLGVYDNGFSEQDFELAISDLTYSVGIGPLDTEVSAEYQHSDVPELRRTRLTATVGHTLTEPQLGYEFTIEGDLAFSDFNGGANDRRNDVTAALVVVAERELVKGLSLVWEAAFVNRFSNRERSRFTGLELMAEVSKRF